MMTFTNKQLGGWAKDVADTMIGQIVNRANVTEKEMDAYRAGIIHGYGAAIRDLKLHGAIRETYNDR